MPQCHRCSLRKKLFTPTRPSPLASVEEDEDDDDCYYYDALSEDEECYCDESNLSNDSNNVINQQSASSDIMNVIEQCPLFKNASKEFFLDLIMQLKPLLLHPQQQIIGKGDVSKWVYWLIKGTAVMNSGSHDTKNLHAELAPGSYFGESSLLVQSPRSTSMVAQTRCLMMFIDSKALLSILSSYPVLKAEVLSHIRKKATSLELLILQRQMKRPYCNDDGIEISPDNSDDSNDYFFNDSILLKKTQLEKIPLFHSNLPSYELHALAASSEIQSYFQYEYVFRQDCFSRDVYYVTEGVVEVVDQKTNRVKALLTKGSMFGEVTFLGMSSSRTATIRTATPSKCLVISYSVLSDLCRKYPSVLSQIEEVASYHIMHNRLMHHHNNTNEPTQNETHPSELEKKSSGTTFLSDLELPRSYSPNTTPQPPPPPPSTMKTNSTTNPSITLSVPSPYEQAMVSSSSSSSSSRPLKRQKITPSRYKRRTSLFNVGPFPDVIQIRIFQYLSLPTLMRLQRVCTHWYQILTKSTAIMSELDLSKFNTSINDASIVPITNFAGNRPNYVDISNCFHLTNQGFSHLINGIGLAEVKTFKMKSTWDVSSNSILELTATPTLSAELEKIDLSNCRKVNDVTVARLIGWTTTTNRDNADEELVVGCPNLQSLTLSYCKHITDQTMHYMALYASDRLVELDLTRCTGITDQGFSYWTMKPFENLKGLNLTDCTFLTDKSMIALAGTARRLQHLNLSFCCALTDVSIQVLCLGCPNLKSLTLAYCGPAVTDRSLEIISTHLKDLEHLSIRGCLLVTRVGVDSVLRGCPKLENFNISQCKNVVR